MLTAAGSIRKKGRRRNDIVIMGNDLGKAVTAVQKTDDVTDSAVFLLNNKMK